MARKGGNQKLKLGNRKVVSLPNRFRKGRSRVCQNANQLGKCLLPPERCMHQKPNGKSQGKCQK